jgi:hypothetical protein
MGSHPASSATAAGSAGDEHAPTAAVLDASTTHATTACFKAITGQTS